MTPGARIAAAIEVVDQWLAGEPVEKALTRWARGSRYAGSGDRAAVRDHVYDVLRQKGSCALAGGGESGRALLIGLVRRQGLSMEALFSGTGHAPDPLGDAEAGVPMPHYDPLADIPDWIVPLLTARAPDDPGGLAAAFADRAPLWLRVNLRRTTRGAVAEMLTSDGMEVRPHSDVPTALDVTTAPRRLRQSRAYLDGLVEPQDLSVQAAIAAITWPDRGVVLDYCAGGGGKALAIADRCAAEVVAHDAFPRRMADLAVRAERAGVTIARVETGDLPERAPFDVVVADVPCSGSGTWRRDPEAKWRLDVRTLEDMVTDQAQILDEAAALVAANGRLIYMTCSLFRSENEAQIEAFLARHDGWVCTRSRMDTPLTASDGFFSAELCRATP